MAGERAERLRLGRCEIDPLLSPHRIGGYHHMRTTGTGSERDRSGNKALAFALETLRAAAERGQ